LLPVCVLDSAEGTTAAAEVFTKIIHHIRIIQMYTDSQKSVICNIFK